MKSSCGLSVFLSALCLRSAEACKFPQVLQAKPSPLTAVSRAAWAVDSSADVSKAFEFKNFGVFGALLIQVISGDHFKGISQVGNLSVVTSCIDSVAPPVMYTVRTPELKSIGICKKRVLVRTHFPEQTYAALYNKQSLTMSACPQIMKYPQTCAPKPSTAEHWLHPNDTL